VKVLELRMFKKLALLSVGLLLFADSCSAAPEAIATIKDAKGKMLGTATFVQEQEGVRVNVNVSGVAPGKHAMHIHAVGKCDAPAFTSAGSHLGEGQMNTMGSGMAMGSMAGDLPVLVVGKDGKGQANILNKNISFEGGENPLLDDDGAALILHLTATSKQRIACGAITSGVK
jgi:superoxide dismutase, Cu-Zn family